MESIPYSTYSNWMVCYTRKRSYGLSTNAWTFREFKEMCKQLAEELPGYRFAPEAIGDGGLEITDWPGKKPHEYKSFRLLATNYPWISDKTPDTASFNVYSDTGLFITLKAFYGAPRFNVSELQAFQKVMQQVVGLPAFWHMTAVGNRIVKQLHKESVVNF